MRDNGTNRLVRNNLLYHSLNGFVGAQGLSDKKPQNAGFSRSDQGMVSPFQQIFKLFRGQVFLDAIHDGFRHRRLVFHQFINASCASSAAVHESQMRGMVFLAVGGRILCAVKANHFVIPVSSP